MPGVKNLATAAGLFYKWTGMNDHPKNTLRTTLTTPDTLASAGLIDSKEISDLQAVAERYAIAVPSHLADLIGRGSPDDPIAKQFLPSLAELKTLPEENADPIGDHPHSPIKGVVHRYPDRLLLKVHSACAVYCRFCFRREMVGPSGDSMDADDLENAFAYVREHNEVWEVILTGGDPLVLSPRKIAHILDKLDDIPHVQVVRFHTRLPVAAPDRISKALVETLQERRVTVYIAVHANHAKEFSQDTMSACARLARAGIPLVGQSVLLKGINDSTEALTALFRAMVRARIKPYYLNHPDLAPGTSHFRVSIETGQALMKALRGQISGLALPTYILDIPGGYGKVPVEAPYLEHSDASVLVVEDVNGDKHLYPLKSESQT